MFQTQYQPLSEAYPAFGRVALLPWDVEIFGFAVGNYETGDLEIVASQRDLFRSALQQWASDHAVELIACRVPANHFAWIALLPMLGFTMVDFEVIVSLPRLQATSLPPTRIPVRLAGPEDQPFIERIAETSFLSGRYHTDARFPQHLANRRYRQWIRNAFAYPEPETYVYVIGEPGLVQGFLHVVIREGGADLRLGAIDKQAASLPGLGFHLYVGTLIELKKRGVRQVVTKISPVNTSVMNIYGAIEVRFLQPEVIFHWHAPAAPHLLGEDVFWSMQEL
jgi:hypothetical protein